MKRLGSFARRLAFLAAIALAIALVVGRDTPAPPTGVWMATAGVEARYETIDGVRVRYVRTGRGPTVLLLHGIASSLYTWRGVLPALARDHDVVAVDLPGFGGSDVAAATSWEAFPRAILGLMDGLGIARTSIVGNSLGGLVAALVTTAAPERVDRLVLIDSAGFNLAPERRPALLRVLGSRAGAALARLPYRRVLVELALRQVFENDALVTRDRVDEYYAPLARAGVAANLVTLLSSADPTLAADFPRRAATIKAPTLIVWGDADRWIPRADADLFMAAIPGARKVVIERCGHMPQEERPDAVGSLLAEFLRAQE